MSIVIEKYKSMGAFVDVRNANAGPLTYCWHRERMHGGPNNQNTECRGRNRFREFADILIMYFCGTNSLKIEWLQTPHIYYLTVLVGHQLGIVQ